MENDTERMTEFLRSFIVNTIDLERNDQQYVECFVDKLMEIHRIPGGKTILTLAEELRKLMLRLLHLNPISTTKL